MDNSVRLPTSLRPLLILEVLAAAGEPMTATEIGKKVGLSKPTIHRLCAMMESEGLLTRHGETRRFVPARRTREMASGLIYASRSHITRHQVLQDVAAQVRETVNFVVPEATGMSYLDRVETDWPFRVQFPVGSNVPFHCTASGKCFMASLQPAAREAFVAGLTLQKMTPHTHTTPDTLLEDLERIAERGHSIDNEEFIEGLVAIAVPVRDPAERFVAALAFHGPVQRLSVEDALARRDVLTTGAARLSAALFAD